MDEFVYWLSISISWRNAKYTNLTVFGTFLKISWLDTSTAGLHNSIRS